MTTMKDKFTITITDTATGQVLYTGTYDGDEHTEPMDLFWNADGRAPEWDVKPS